MQRDGGERDGLPDDDDHQDGEGGAAVGEPGVVLVRREAEAYEQPVDHSEPGREQPLEDGGGGDDGAGPGEHQPAQHQQPGAAVELLEQEGDERGQDHDQEDVDGRPPEGAAYDLPELVVPEDVPVVGETGERGSAADEFAHSVPLEGDDDIADQRVEEQTGRPEDRGSDEQIRPEGPGESPGKRPGESPVHEPSVLVMLSDASSAARAGSAPVSTAVMYCLMGLVASTAAHCGELGVARPRAAAGRHRRRTRVALDGRREGRPVGYVAHGLRHVLLPGVAGEGLDHLIGAVLVAGGLGDDEVGAAGEDGSGDAGWSCPAPGRSRSSPSARDWPPRRSSPRRGRR